MPRIGDAFGTLLWDIHRGARGEIEIVERDDGRLDLGAGAYYFFPYERWYDLERELIDLVRGRVLDVGAGAGRHALHLQEKGHDVTAIDPSPLAARVCRARGLKDVRAVPLARLEPDGRPYDTVIMMGNNFGVFGTPQGAVRQLRRLAHMTTDDARIIATTHNVHGGGKEHRAYHAHNRTRGRLAGQVRLRVRYKDLATPWFDYLLVSPAELRAIVRDTPWRVRELHGDTKQLYAAVLSKA